ncbi:MAG: TAT-variant-translocated molybdopterin oxidoreductase, partial [Marinobacter sp.]
MSSIIARDSEPAGYGREGTGYWRSLAELARTPAYRALSEGEFADPARLWKAPELSRRNMLKLLGASMALAGLGGCSRQPEEHIVPYVSMPEHLVPGRA